MSIPVTGTFAPAGSGGFPIYDQADGKGIHKIVDDNTARDLVPTLHRVEGMTSYSVATATTYRLVGGTANANWAAVTTAPSGSASGDLSGTYPGPTVAKINGSSVPAGGALTTGNVLQVTGAATLSYAAINLAGGANFVTGALPIANVAAGSNGQVLTTASGAPAWGNDFAAQNLTTTGSYYSGSATPAAEQAGSHVAVSTGSTSLRGLISWQHSSDTNGARIWLGKSRGTRTAKTTVVNGDTLARILFSAYDGTTQLETAQIQAVSNGTVATNSVPTDLAFFVGATSSPSEIFRFVSDGTAKVNNGFALKGQIAAGGGVYRNLLSWTTANNALQIGDQSSNFPSILLDTSTGVGTASNGAGSVFQWSGGSSGSLLITAPTLGFSLTTAVIRGGDAAAAAGSGLNLAIRAGNTADQTSGVSGGILTISGGDTSGTTGGNTYTGGDLVTRGGDSAAGGTSKGGNHYLDVGRGSTTIGNLAFGARTGINFQSMQGGIFIANRAAAPTGNPSGGGYLYAEAGALKYLGSSGTPTTLAVA